MFKNFCLVALASCLFLPHSQAQSNISLITGTITDSSGAVVPQAQIEVTGRGASGLRTTKTDGAGSYVIPQLPPGIYELSVKKQGFTTENRPNILLEGNQIATVNLALTVSSVAETVQVMRRWDFDNTGNQEGWNVRPDAGGAVMGGSLWLALSSKETDAAKISARGYQIVGPSWESLGDLASSPPDLEIPAGEVNRVRMRVLNLSPVTDFFLLWRTKEQGWGTLAAPGFLKPTSQSQRCTLKADLKQWQEITCFFDGQQHGMIDQIAIRLSQFAQLRGDIWIDWIEIGKGPPKPLRERPDVASSRVVPKITLPGISQAGFADAFKVLDECLIVDLPVEGFYYPVMAPGGFYGEHWWALDSSLTVTGAKWANPRFAEDVMRGFRDVQAQNPDGRIDGEGNSATRGQVADVSQLPRFFEVAYDVARRTPDPVLRGEIYQTMRRYLDWWISPVKRDTRTGLIAGAYEDGDTFGELLHWSNPPAVAPVDLNVAVAIGAKRTAELALGLGKQKEADRYEQVFQDLSRAINTTLWDEKDGVYYNYDFSTGRARRRLIVSTFDPLRIAIAPPTRRDRLLRRMLDPAQFNWSRLPLTSLSMTDPGYVEAKGDYDGRAWLGDVWTLRNMMVVSGLEDSGRPDLAAELNWTTIKAFHANYYEFLLPSSGEGQSNKRYGWSASQYIEAIIEHLFGVDVDALHNRVRVVPHVPTALYGQNIALDDLILPTGKDTRLSVRINQSTTNRARITVSISGPLPKEFLQVSLPGSAKEITVSAKRFLSVEFP